MRLFTILFFWIYFTLFLLVNDLRRYFRTSFKQNINEYLHGKTDENQIKGNLREPKTISKLHRFPHLARGIACTIESHEV